MSANSVISFDLDLDPNDLYIVHYNGVHERIKLKDLIHYGKFKESPVKKPQWHGQTPIIDHSVRKSKYLDIESMYFFPNAPEGYTLEKYVCDNMFRFISTKYNYCHEYRDAICPLELVEEKLKGMVPKQFRHCLKKCINKDNRYNLLNNKIMALKYDEGGFFAKHTDSIKDKYHFATVLIIIPPFIQEFKHEGGILRVWDEAGKLYEFDSSKMTKITVVAFNPTFQHECTPVTSGTRLVFKTDWSYDKYVFDLALAQTSIYSQLEELKVDNQPIVQKIIAIKKELDKKMDSMIQEIPDNFTDAVKDFDPLLHQLKKLDEEVVELSPYKIGDMISILKDQIGKKRYAMIPLHNYYQIEDLRFLYKNELELYKVLTKVFGRIGIKNIKKRVKYETEFYDRDDIPATWEPSEFASPSQSGKLMIYAGEDKYKKETVASNMTFVMAVNDGEKFGKTVKEFEYNDSTYDSIHNISYTCFIVKLDYYEQIITFLAIWSLRKEECPIIGLLPFEIVQSIIQKI